MLRKIINSGLFFILLLTPFFLNAEILEPVKWEWHTKKVSANEVDLIFKAKIDKPWHLYAQEVVKDGPIPTSFNFDKSSGYTLVGKTKEEKPITEVEPLFNNAVLSYYEGSATFTQRIKINSSKDFKATGYLEFMTCNDKQCLPPTQVDFTFNIKGDKQNTSKADNNTTAENGFGQASSNNFNVTLGQSSTQSGILDPVDWKIRKKQINDTIYQAIFTADIDEGWHIYSEKIPDSIGPVPTSIKYTVSNDWVKDGDLQSDGKMVVMDDPNFGAKLSFYKNKVTFKQNFKVLKSNASVKGYISYMACTDEKCVPPKDQDFTIEFSNSQVAVTGGDKAEIATVDKDNELSKNSLWSIFWICFLGGFAVLLTPCVFPMIPLTVSFFTKQSKTRLKGIRNAIGYGLSIIVIFVLLGTIITATFGPSALNAFSTNVTFNIFLFVILTIFAISFLGAFELTLPSSWLNKVDNLSSRGGIIGIFFMALTLALVSFSCTAPVVGPLLVLSAKGGGAGPIIGMLGFSLALALPFTLFALFPSWLNSMPKSGGWLNTTKVFLGFIELAFAFKFLSNADLVVQAHILTREVFIAIWIAVFAALTLYLLGLIHLSSDGEKKGISTGRLLLGILGLCFTMYLIPGMWGAPLKLISGFPPPQFYSESPKGVGAIGNITTVSSNGEQSSIPKGADPENCPYGLNCFHDYETGMAYAKKVKKPVLVDFTGYACVNCRKMEQFVWSDQRVLKMLRNDVVLISLYVDDKTELPKSEQKTVSFGSGTMKLRTIGNKWSHFEATRYDQNTQPLYAFIDLNEKELVDLYTYNSDPQKYIDWLNKGIEEFKNRQGKEE